MGDTRSLLFFEGGPAPADLRDIPLGTVLHVRGFLPPDPKISAVPVLAVDNKDKIAGYKRPRSVSFLSDAEIPRTATGKIQHRLLRQRLADIAEGVTAG